MTDRIRDAMPTDGQRLRDATRHPASRPAAGWAYRRLLAAALTIVVAACSRGPAPPSPTEDLVPSVVGVVVQGADEPPFLLEDGETFDPPEGASVRHVKNWPANPAFEEDVVRPGNLLLGGQASDGSWCACRSMGRSSGA